MRIGRYVVDEAIASGGMATVHRGRLVGAAGFSRPVAVKRLHPQFAKDPELVTMFLDEARLAARIRHPNVVQTLDVVARDDEVFLVMDYVHGESVARLWRRAKDRGDAVPVPVAAAVLVAMLEGLHAAHEATGDDGAPLEIVHRDVSPQNVLVGADGVARVLDFGVAKAASRAHVTRDGQVKGKVAYMAPEQLSRGLVDRRADVYAAGVVFWELLTMTRLFDGESEGEIVGSVLKGRVDAPSTVAKDDGVAALDDVVLRALEREPHARFGTARAMARAIEAAVGSSVASTAEVAEWVQDLAGDDLAKLAQQQPAAVPTAAPQTSPALRARRAWRTTAAFCAGLAVAAAIFTVTLRARHEAPSVATAAPAEATEAPRPVEAPPEVVSDDLPAADPAPAVPAQAAPHRPTRPPPRAAAPSKKPCTVKSFFDDAGVKHFFNDCPKAP